MNELNCGSQQSPLFKNILLKMVDVQSLTLYKAAFLSKNDVMSRSAEVHVDAGGASCCCGFTHKVFMYLQYKGVDIIFRWVEQMMCHNILSKAKQPQGAANGVLSRGSHAWLSRRRLEFASYQVSWVISWSFWCITVLSVALNLTKHLWAIPKPNHLLFLLERNQSNKDAVRNMTHSTQGFVGEALGEGRRSMRR